MNTKLIEWVLRIAVAGEFIGHGMFALQKKAGWFKYFEKNFCQNKFINAADGRVKRRNS